jgi:tRNA(Ile)-lysidine synthetase-like protein
MKPNLWFNANTNEDIYLTNKYGCLLGIKTSYDCRNRKKLVGYIILHDQISRHVNRVHGNVDLSYHLKLALIASEYTIEYRLDTLSVADLCFVLLPYRHTNITSNIVHAIEIMWSYVKCHRARLNDNDISLAKRFLKASYERIDVYNQRDQIKQMHSSSKSYHKMFQKEPPNYDLFHDILDNKPTNFNYDECSIIRDRCFTEIETMIKNQKPKAVILSLSMGVDSAICSIVLSKLRQKYQFDLIAIHINYCNRDRSIREELFVESWCDFMNIPCYTRRITEITREPCMELNLRELYETYTKNVRMNTYKTVWNDFLKLDGNPVVVLGHNKNDCFENILTNITQQKKYDNLRGMASVDCQDDITFWRPLLNTTKDEIKQFAQTYNIPHLMNSTPAWSARGKIRDIVRPTLERWDARCIEGMFQLSEVVSSLTEILDDTVKMLINNVIVSEEDGNVLYTLNNLTSISTNPVFWTTFLIKLFKGNSLISHKSIQSLVDRIKTWQSNQILKVVLSKSITLYATHIKNSKSYKIAISCKTNTTQPSTGDTMSAQ